MSMRYLLLAEGFSGDPLYGKTMRGVLRYRREDVVAILDSTRAGETEEGVPVVESVADVRRGSNGPLARTIGGGLRTLYHRRSATSSGDSSTKAKVKTT